MDIGDSLSFVRNKLLAINKMYSCGLLLCPPSTHPSLSGSQYT